MSRLISLQEIRDAKPCAIGWTKLLNSLGGFDTPMSTLVSIGDIAKSNDAQDALWCCRLIDDRRFVVSLIMPAVKRASNLSKDKRVHDCITDLDAWLSGIDAVDLEAADAAAYAAYAADAAYAAADAADAAAYADDAAAYAADAASARAAERAKQVEDIIHISPLYALK